jgi:hypothetical protein
VRQKHTRVDVTIPLLTYTKHLISTRLLPWCYTETADDSCLHSPVTLTCWFPCFREAVRHNWLRCSTTLAFKYRRMKRASQTMSYWFSDARLFQGNCQAGAEKWFPLPSYNSRFLLHFGLKYMYTPVSLCLLRTVLIRILSICLLCGFVKKWKNNIFKCNSLCLLNRAQEMKA